MTTKWLVIGNSEYKDDDIEDVPAVENSIDYLKRSIQKAFGDTAIIECISNLSNSELISSIANFYKTVKNDELPIFYFCGHGYRENKHLYLATTDSIASAIGHSALEFGFVTECIKRNRINYAAIILDCCFSGTANGLSVDDNYSVPLSETDYPNIVCLTSCKSIEKAQIEMNAGQYYAAFTYWFASTIADGIENEKERYSFKDICDHVAKRLGKQVPTIQATGSISIASVFPNLQRKIDEFAPTYCEDVDDTTVLRVLLVKSEISYPIKNNGDFGVPLGLWLLKSYIQRTSANIVVDIYDERLRRLQGKTTSFAECIKQYDVVGVSMCSCEVPPSIEKLRMAKEAGKITIAGGIFTYSNEEYLLKYPYIDFVVPGVGTHPLERLLTELRKRKEYSSIEEICENINDKAFDCFGLQHVYSHSKQNDASMWESATMPHIELDIWDEILREYGPYIDGKIDIYTSRGCNKTCSFCSVQRESKHNVILCDRDHVIRTIKYLYAHGIRKFSIKDEDFFIDGCGRIDRILSAFVDYDDISFKVRARIDTMLETGISSQNLLRYHISEIQYGVESPNNELRKFVQKSIRKTNTEVINLFNSHYECGIIVNASFILGLPGEDKKYYNSLTEFIKKIYRPGLTKVYLNFYTPHPIKGRIPDEMNLVTNDLKYYTHKIPVCFAKIPRAKVKTRQDMLAAYNSIVAMTSSRTYNPPIPTEISKRLTQDNNPASNEIMKYGEDHRC